MKDIGGRNGAFIGHLFQILAFFMLTGIFSTLLIEETKGRTLEGQFSSGFSAKIHNITLLTKS